MAFLIKTFTEFLEMKQSVVLSNKNTIGLRFKTLSILIICNLLLFLILFFIKINITYRLELQIILVISAIILSVLFYRIRYFEYDSSGEVVSLRSYHPVFTNFEKRSEFPKDKLHDFKIVRNNGITLVKIYIKMLETRTISLHYSVQGFKGNAVEALQKSLQSTKERYGNSYIDSLEKKLY